MLSAAKKLLKIDWIKHLMCHCNWQLLLIPFLLMKMVLSLKSIFCWTTNWEFQQFGIVLEFWRSDPFSASSWVNLVFIILWLINLSQKGQNISILSYWSKLTFTSKNGAWEANINCRPKKCLTFGDILT